MFLKCKEIVKPSVKEEKKEMLIAALGFKLT